MTYTTEEPTPEDTPTRRRALSLLGGVGLAAVATACTPSSSSSDTTDATTTTTTAGTGSTSSTTSTSTSSTTTTVGTTSCTTTPSETAGPFPADGTNTNGSGAVANILDDVGVIRADIRSDIDGTDTQTGTDMTLRIRVLDQSAGCTPLAGVAVYVWHCNKEGKYSEYNSSMLSGDYTAYSWLRGVQVTDANGYVTFKTILPGRYQGRAFHIHFAVYSDTTFATKLLTSQLAADDSTISSLYTQAGYSSALAASTTNTADNVFGDGVSQQLLTWSGTVASGLTAAIDVAVA